MWSSTYLHAAVGSDEDTSWAVDSAALQGHVDVVEFLLASRQDGFSKIAVVGAVMNGHLDMVKLLHAHKPNHEVDLTLQAAASFNQFAIVTFMMEFYGPAARNSARTMDLAARDGRLEMVQFLHERNFPCTTSAMDGAAGRSHLDVVKWLHENRTEGCTTNAMDDATAHGHWEVVRWLSDNRHEGCTGAALHSVMDETKWNKMTALADQSDTGVFQLKLWVVGSTVPEMYQQ